MQFAMVIILMPFEILVIDGLFSISEEAAVKTGNEYCVTREGLFRLLTKESWGTPGLSPCRFTDARALRRIRA